jgi:photoactive yellow protein
MKFEKRAGLEILNTLSDMSNEALDRLPFGAIQLDRDGYVLKYNQTEADLTGRDPKRVIGKNFFTQVAPCTNVRDFAGRFRRGVDARELHVVFPFRFDFEMNPIDVSVTLFFHKPSETVWVIVRQG